MKTTKETFIQPQNGNHEPLNSHHIIKSMKAKAASRRSVSQKTADFITKFFGSISFLVIHVIWFTGWILVNLNYFPDIETFDPYPFGLLTMIVSLEAIVLSIFVLMSQNRTSIVDDLRQEVDLQVDIITEQELTKLMTMVARLMEKNGIDITTDRELNEMLRPTNLQKIEKALAKQVNSN